MTKKALPSNKQTDKQHYWEYRHHLTDGDRHTRNEADCNKRLAVFGSKYCPAAHLMLLPGNGLPNQWARCNERT
jgi:hypothetical protein